MLRALAVVTIQTFTLLRRDRIFWPAVAAALAISAFSGVAAQWGPDELGKMLYDFGMFGFQMTGSAVAIFWGVKMIGDARQDGSIEVQLAAPISRSVWLVGKYLGLAACLLLVSALFIVIWQITLLALDFKMMQAQQLAVFGLMILGWLVTGALAVFFATLARASLALFATGAAWVAGLMSSLVDQATTADTPKAMRVVASSIARYWDLQQFNLVDKAWDVALPRGALLLDKVLYGSVLIAILISVAGLVSSRRDVLPA